MFWKKSPTFISRISSFKTAPKGPLIPVVSGLTLLVLVLQLTVNSFAFLTTSAESKTQPTANPAGKQTAASQDFAKTPLSFIEQPGDHPQFLARGKGYTFALNTTEAVLTLMKQQNPPAEPTKTNSLDLKMQQAEKPGLPAPRPAPAVVHMKLDGANPAPQLFGQQEQASKTNYFLGTDSTKWRTNVTNYGQVRYTNVYPGTDMVYYGNDQNQLEYDFILAPGADPSNIKINFEGVDRLVINDQGELVMQLAGGAITQHPPVIYQEKNGLKTNVTGRYLLLPANRVSFEIGTYDKTLPLTIDPSIAFSTLIGGNLNDAGEDIAVDSSGNSYIVGITGEISDSGINTFPIKNAYDTSYNGSVDIFISKFDTNGGLVYSTFLGGSGYDEAFHIAVDSSGATYFAGQNDFGGFPMVGASYNTSNSGKFDVIAGKLNPGGSLVYSTYLGGTETELALGLAIDSAGAMYIAGGTTSDDFPTVSPFQAHLHPTPNDPNFPEDGFVTKINTNGSLGYSSYLGGTYDDVANGIAVDSGGDAYILGQTYSDDFPMYGGAQTTNHGNADDFIMKFDAGGSPVYSTFLGGSGMDGGGNIAVNSLDEAIVVGNTQSTDFPLQDAIQPDYPTIQVSEDGFITRLSADGGSFLFSTYLGGTGGGVITDVAVDGNDSFTVVGGGSSGFPVFYPFLAAPNYSNISCGCSIIARFDSNNYLSYLTYFGPGITGVAVQPDGTTYITGLVSPPPNDYFRFYNAIQTTFGGGLDGFVAKIKSPIYVLTATQQALQDALNQAATGGGEVIVTTFVTTLTLTSNLDIPKGVSLVADCTYNGPNGPSLEIVGPGTITLHGNTQLIGLKLKHIKVNNDGYNNLAQCLIVDNTP